MNTHTSYTDRYSADEMYDGDWDDLLRPDEYEDILDQKRFNQSMGQSAWPVSYTHLPLPTTPYV